MAAIISSPWQVKPQFISLKPRQKGVVTVVVKWLSLEVILHVTQFWVEGRFSYLRRLSFFPSHLCTFLHTSSVSLTAAYITVCYWTSALTRGDTCCFRKTRARPADTSIAKKTQHFYGCSAAEIDGFNAIRSCWTVLLTTKQKNQYFWGWNDFCVEAQRSNNMSWFMMSTKLILSGKVSQG